MKYPKAFLDEMACWGLREEDIREIFVKSAGPGGQNVNKVATCVYLKHLPSGIEVKCQRERSQAQNRYLARKILLRKIRDSVLEGIAREKERIEKIRRQKRKVPEAVKSKILEAKRRQARKKSLRAKVRDMEE